MPATSSREFRPIDRLDSKFASFKRLRVRLRSDFFKGTCKRRISRSKRWNNRITKSWNCRRINFATCSTVRSLVGNNRPAKLLLPPREYAGFESLVFKLRTARRDKSRCDYPVLTFRLYAERVASADTPESCNYATDPKYAAPRKPTTESATTERGAKTRDNGTGGVLVRRVEDRLEASPSVNLNEARYN